MLEINIPDLECYDYKKEEFLTFTGKKYKFEHSLVSLSKWEEKWRKPFLSVLSNKMSAEELFSYIKFMCITRVEDDRFFDCLPANIIKQIISYMNDPCTATTFQHYGTKEGKNNGKSVTSEELYYLMFTYGIPMECEKWNLNRLLALIEIFNIKNDTSNSKLSKKETAQMYKSLNDIRKAKYHTNG